MIKLMNKEESHDQNIPKKENWIFLSRAKLKAVSRTSALLSGFAMVAMVEISLDNHKESKSSVFLISIYSILTCLVVGIHLLALMMSTCILPLLEDYDNFCPENDHVIPIYIGIAWILSTGLGILMFLIEIVFVFWVKFFLVMRSAAIVASVIIVPVIILFSIFSIQFYRRLVLYKLTHNRDELDRIEIELTNIRVSEVKSN